MSLEVGARIRQIRADRGVAEFAESLEVNRKTVTRWEAGDALPDGPSLLALKEKYGVDPGWVLTGAGAAPTIDQLTPEEQLLLSRFRDSPRPIQDAALRVLLLGEEKKEQTKKRERDTTKQLFLGSVGDVNNVKGKNRKVVIKNKVK